VRILHAGCGHQPLPAPFVGDEVRLDIDTRCKPDVVAGLTDLGDIGEFDAVYCAHSLEHLYPHDVPTALAEFHRVLKPGGAAVIIVPDLEDVRPTEDFVYMSDGGPICGLDMYYGKRSLIEASPYMAHHCGFVAATLGRALEEAGFSTCFTKRCDTYNLVGVGVR